MGERRKSVKEVIPRNVMLCGEKLQISEVVKTYSDHFFFAPTMIIVVVVARKHRRKEHSECLLVKDDCDKSNGKYVQLTYF